MKRKGLILLPLIGGMMLGGCNILGVELELPRIPVISDLIDKITGKEEAPVKYTVTFNTNGGSTVSSKTAENGSKITLPTPTKDGYTFKGWSTDRTITVDSITMNSDNTMYAVWEAKNSTVPTPRCTKNEARACNC